MSLEPNKTLGGIGAILIAVGSFVPILSIIGIILVLIAMKGLAEYYKENSIFENALYGFIFGIIGIIAAIVMFFTVFFAGITTPFSPNFTVPSFTISLIGVLIVMFIFYLIGAIFYRKSFTLLSEKSGEKMFDTAGLLLLIGAILTIIFIGAILMLVAWILAAVGFFSIKAQPTQPLAAEPPPPPPSLPTS